MGSKGLTPLARKLRVGRTGAEDHLWQRLRNHRLEGEKFVFQFQIANYIADFACRIAHLAIEVDGGQHSAEKDAARTGIIESYHRIVLRFWNRDVLQDTDSVLEAIRAHLLIARNRCP